MRALFCVDSCLQIIVAVQLRITIYKEYDVDLIVYNSMRDAIKIQSRMQNLKIFDNVYLAKGNLLYIPANASIVLRIKKYLTSIYSILFPKKAIIQTIGDKLNKKYDYFLFNGDGFLPEFLFEVCYSNNNKLRCYRFEDGVGSLIEEYPSKIKYIRTYIEKIAKFFLKRKNIRYFVDGYYFIKPEIVFWRSPVEKIKIPKITKSNKYLLSILNEVFDVNVNELRIFSEKKVVFFDDLVDGEENIEYNALTEILKVIPKDQIVVKLHPKNTDNHYKYLGVIVSDTIVPWELVELNLDLNETILVSFTSTALIYSDAVFETRSKKILLHNVIPDSSYSSWIIASINKIREYEKILNASNNKNNILIPSNYDEMRSIILDLIMQDINPHIKKR